MKRNVVTMMALVAIIMVAFAWPVCAENEFDALTIGQQIADFKLKTIYENEYGDAVGAEFRHVPSGFVLDVLRIQSYPQGFIWVNALPPTDGGEPHTTEHLVLGKGPKAQWVASYEDMSLASSSAGTGQVITGYHFYAGAGKDAFFKLMEVKIDALINPDYTDEEIRREMCNIGYSIDPTDSSVTLEEKGSVYTEMVSGFEGTWNNMWFKLHKAMYGEDHPLSNESGGYPPAIRERTAEDLRKFHETYYKLNNMGMVTSIPDEISLEEHLTRTSEIFARIEPDASPGEDPALCQERFPKPQSAEFGSILIGDFPHQNDKEPGVMLIVWPPALEYDFNEAFLRECLIITLGSGESSNLYKKFVDSQTRTLDIGASGVFAWTSEGQGCPAFIGFSNVSQDAVNEQMIDSVRSLILAEIKAIAQYPDGSDELKEFNKRVANHVTQTRRALRKSLNSPPGFGFRGASFWWMEHLHELYRIPGDRKKLTNNSRLEFVEELLDSGKNFWKSYIDKWGLLTNTPYGAGARPNPEMIARAEVERDQRLAAFTESLKEKYGVDNESEAIEKYIAEYDARTAVIEKASASVETPRFLDEPPLTLDPQLNYHIEQLPGGGDNLVATFNNITSAQVGLCLNMNVVPESLLVYVSALPTMLTEVGVMKDGQPLAYDETGERIKQEILFAGANFDLNHFTERAELLFVASGSTLDESVKAVEWLETFLFDSDWRPENLSRIRDAIDNSLTSARNGMKGWEEYWVNNPIRAYWKQDHPLLLAAGSFLTQQHSLLRARWLLKEAADEAVLNEFEAFMAALAAYGEGADRASLTALARTLSTGSPGEDGVQPPQDLLTSYEALSDAARELVKAAAGDLIQTMATLPDGSLGADWAYLCRTMATDLAAPAAVALDRFKMVMNLVRHKDNVRAYMVGSETSQETLLPEVNKLVERFTDEASVAQSYTRTPIVFTRLKARTSEDITPVYCGLLNENTRNGLFSNAARCASVWDTDEEKILDFLSARLYGGGGAHSMFMKTWAAGLAYSNGLRSNQFSGRLTYYAERCPSLVQTMQFVVNELKKAEPGSDLTEYAVAQAFGGGRAGNTYETRGSAMAANLTDGLTPELISQFRQTVLELRKRPDFFEELKQRMLRTYGRVLPGLEPNGTDVEGACYLMIGPEAQFADFEKYLKTVESDDVNLYRIYPRDFWLVSSAN